MRRLIPATPRWGDVEIHALSVYTPGVEYGTSKKNFRAVKTDLH